MSEPLPPFGRREREDGGHGGSGLGAVAKIPASRTSLIGRERELAALCAMLLGDGAPLVTMTGVGGGGKTRLAMAVIAEVEGAFGGAVHWVSLAPVADPALLPQAVASALGVVETAGTPLIETVATRLAAERCLLVLDNCEHLLDACADLVEHLLVTCPDLQILATSREPLMVAGEQQWRVPPLPVPDLGEPASPDSLARAPAVRLFVERAQAIVPAFRLTPANAEAVAEVCVRLDGIPLALELAAARVRVLSVEQILARLDDAFRLLTGGSRAAPTRQQTLRATLDWSYDLLTESEQTFFRRLAVFAGSFDLESVEVVCEGVDALDLVMRLADKSLLIVEADSQVARYRLLEPVRQYAGQHLSANREDHDAQAQHAACYLALAEQAAPELRGPTQAAWLARLDRDYDNFRVALHWAEGWGDAEFLGRLAVALAPFWEVRGYLSEGRRWLRAVLSASHTHQLPAALRMATLDRAGMLAYWQADLDTSAAWFEESMALARAIGDQQAIADSLTWLAAVRRRQTRLADAAALLQESLPLHRALENQPGSAWALYNLGLTAGAEGDYARTVPLLEEALRRYHAIGDAQSAALTGVMLADALTHVREHARAAGLLREALAALRAIDDRTSLLSALLTVAWMAARMDQPVRAGRLLGAADARRESLGATLAPINRLTQEETFRAIRQRLDEVTLAHALAAGRRMTLDEAMAEAMNVGEPESPANVADAPLAATVEALTRREREIIPLLARGATDREIAEVLSIAVSTVGVHVHHILGKLGLNSRWQVADWAVANGLAPAPSD